MRVLHCYSGNLYGGIEAMLATLARRRGQAPDMEPHFALCFEGRLSEELHAAGSPVHRIGPVRFGRPWTVLAARRRLRGLLRRLRPDVAVCHAPWSHALDAPAIRGSGCPLVFWQHDFAGSGHWAERLASRTPPDLVLSNSLATASTAPRIFPGVPLERLRYPVAPPPPPPDPGACRAEVRRELDTPEGSAVIVQTCRLERWKGHTLLIEALGRLREVPGWIAWVAGGAQRPREHTYLEELESLASSLGVADRVRFLGQRGDVPRLLAAADLHCQPNTGPEPFGIAFVEALYAGLPVVSTRMGGAAEIVDEGCGILVDPGDAEALASALRRLIADPAERARLGSAGPPRASRLCDPGLVLGRLRGLLRGVAGPAATAAVVGSGPDGGTTPGVAEGPERWDTDR